MKARFYSLVLLTVSMLVGCTEVNDPVLDQEVNQNEENIAQLKAMAEEAGWIVSPKVLESARTTPLTKGEIGELQEDLNVYSLFPETSEKREMEVVPLGGQYVFMPMFVPRVETKATTGGSIYVNAAYGYCFFNNCNQISIKVCYDLDENGAICYAFGGAGSNFEGSKPVYCGDCRKAVSYSTLYYECSWGASQVNLSLWLTHLTYYNASVITGGLDFTSSNRVYLFSKGYVDIKTGAYHFDTHEISRSELPPEIYTR